MPLHVRLQLMASAEEQSKNDYFTQDEFEIAAEEYEPSKYVLSELLAKQSPGLAPTQKFNPDDSTTSTDSHSN
ncbi:hypothetical protein RF55_15979, partial [Lasius niger]